MTSHQRLRVVRRQYTGNPFASIDFQWQRNVLLDSRHKDEAEGAKGERLGLKENKGCVIFRLCQSGSDNTTNNESVTCGLSVRPPCFSAFAGSNNSSNKNSDSEQREQPGSASIHGCVASAPDKCEWTKSIEGWVACNFPADRTPGSAKYPCTLQTPGAPMILLPAPKAHQSPSDLIN